MADTVIVNTDEVQVKTLRDLSKANRTLCKYGDDAYDKGNYPYAVDMYRRLLKKEPMALEVREKLHDAQMKACKGAPGVERSLEDAKTGVFAEQSPAPVVRFFYAFYRILFQSLFC